VRDTPAVRHQIGLSLVFIFMGLLLGIVGNLFVSFFINMINTSYSRAWVISTMGGGIVLVIFSVWWLRYAINLLRTPENNRETTEERMIREIQEIRENLNGLSQTVNGTNQSNQLLNKQMTELLEFQKTLSNRLENLEKKLKKNVV
jgi:hypothetical protein